MRFRRALLIVLTVLFAAVPFVRAQRPGRSGTLPPGNWQAHTVGPYTVYAEPQDAPAARALLKLYEEKIPEFARELGVQIPDGIRVFIAPNRGRFRYLTRGLPDWTGGVAYPRERVIIIQAPRLYNGSNQFAITALHESVHILTDYGGPSHLPRWLAEGLAMYLSGETMYKHQAPLGRAVVLGKTYTLKGIEDMLRLGPEQARVAYLQSINFVEFLVKRYGWSAIARLIRGYREGENPDEMFISITGRDLFSVEAAWHQHLRHEYRWWRLYQWVDFDTILWTSASLLVIFAGGLAIYRRKKYLHSKDDDDDRWGGGEPLEPIPGEWYVDDDY